MRTIAEIEQAAVALSPNELRALLGRLEARLRLSDSQAGSKATESLLQTLRELSRPMGGKSWQNRDELHER